MRSAEKSAGHRQDRTFYLLAGENSAAPAERQAPFLEIARPCTLGCRFMRWSVMARRCRVGLAALTVSQFGRMAKAAAKEGGGLDEMRYMGLDGRRCLANW